MTTDETDLMAQWAVLYGDFYALGTRQDLEFRLTRNLIFAARRWTHMSEEIVKAATGQSRARWQTLFAIAFIDPPITILQLAERLGVQWPTLVRTLNGLETEGFIQRIDNPEDRRSRLIQITPKGRAMVADVQPVLDPARSSALAALTDAQLRDVAALVDLIARPGTTQEDDDQADRKKGP